MPLELHAQHAVVSPDEMGDLLVDGGWGDVDGDDLRMRMRHGRPATTAVVDHHLRVEVPGRGMGPDPVL